MEENTVKMNTDEMNKVKILADYIIECLSRKHGRPLPSIVYDNIDTMLDPENPVFLAIFKKQNLLECFKNELEKLFDSYKLETEPLVQPNFGWSLRPTIFSILKDMIKCGTFAIAFQAELIGKSEEICIGEATEFGRMMQEAIEKAKAIDKAKAEAKVDV